MVPPRASHDAQTTLATSDAQPSAAFTPGPWRVSATDDTLVLGGLREKIATAAMKPTQAEEAANAILIAAAPDMYGALKEAIELIVDLSRARWSEVECTEDELVGGFRTVLAQAEGRSQDGTAEPCNSPGRNKTQPQEDKP